MRPTPLTARKAGAVLAVLMLSTALTACQPQASAASTTPPTSAATPTAQASAPASGSPSSSSNSTGSPDGSQSNAPQGLESFYSQTIDWKDCSDGTSPFQCGTVTVPLDWAQSLTDQLNNGHLLTVKGYGHGASGSCAGAAMIDFLVNGPVPAEGPTCDAGPQQAAGGAEG